MKLKYKYSSKEEIPQGYEDLYTEVGGEWVCTGVEGMKTQDDIDRLQTALQKERTEHKDTKKRYSSLADYDLDEVVEKLDSYDELKARAESNGASDEKINELAEARLKTRLGPVERENKQLKEQLAERDEKLTSFEQKDRQRLIKDHLTDACRKKKIRDEAMDDVLMYGDRVFDIEGEGDNARVITKDGVGVTPGIDAQVWLTEMQDKRPHWWGPSQGGGSRGGQGGGQGGANPWSKEGWNMTEQSKMYRENAERAEQMAKAAGTSIGGRRPA